MELADALLENTSVASLRLGAAKYTKSSAGAMANYMRTSKRLQRICWPGSWMTNDRSFRQYEDTFCCFLPALQESTALKELNIHFPLIGEPSNLALKNILTHTQSLRSLSIICPVGPLEDIAMTAARFGLQKNTTVRELTLEVSQGATTLTPILTSLLNQPLLRKLCLHGDVRDLTGLETLLLSDTSNITELEIHRYDVSPRIIGLTRVLHAWTQRPTLTKLGLRCCPLDRDEARLIRLALCNIPSLQSLVLTDGTLGSVGLAELAPALYRNTFIKVLDISENDLFDMDSAEILRDVLRSNKIMTALDLSGNKFGETNGAVGCIGGGLRSNSTLLKLDLSSCALSDRSLFTLSVSTTLQQLTLGSNSVASMGVVELLDWMKQRSRHITDLDLQSNHTIGNGGASHLATSLRHNVLPNLTRISL
jgi:hypothetical protein